MLTNTDRSPGSSYTCEYNQHKDVLSSILKIWGVQSPKEGTKNLAVEFVIALAKARVRAPRMMSKVRGYADKHTCSCMYQMPWAVSRYLYTKVLRFLNCRHIFSLS
ncbi:hypothetical protein POM88_054526 [Heracleum sosnowskyi]|uniref:Uncharacterized protein n=1 Tax=Heracleum sosnowskyi TaxID=360622 RepID=A0AAD8GNI1_9APIA|nr:hypothetical protein POM88_054526 [Heracleum sosnowskyi]